MTLAELLTDESKRADAFPVVRDGIFLAHAGVTILPRVVAQAMADHAMACCERMQEFPEAFRAIQETRVLAAQLVGAEADEVSLLGPTSLGLSLVANGLDWQAGDELVCHAEDYPANVYPWVELERKGVIVRRIRPPSLGEITPELVAAELTKRTRLVALASCHFLTGYRIDIDTIGSMLHERGILFCLDAIQTVGAFPTQMKYVDFLAADSHKWMLGPMSAGIFVVKAAVREKLRPTLIGAWNVHSPNFIAQEEVRFEEGGRRYEPGVLNLNGILGMKAGIELILEMGLDKIGQQLLRLKHRLLGHLEPMGFEVLGPVELPHASGITTVSREPTRGRATVEQLFAALQVAKIHPSLRHDRAGKAYLRFSPHFYNTEAEMDRVAEVIRHSDSSHGK